ncbi:hypothetical protein RI367_000042 [Sorochytrium milnesiophthora]
MTSSTTTTHPPLLLHAVRYSDLLKAVRDFRGALHAVAQKGEILATILASLMPPPPAAARSSGRDQPPNAMVGNVGFLAELTNLVGSSHQLLGDMLWREMELPIVRDFQDLNIKLLDRQTSLNNKNVKLHAELLDTEQKLAKIQSKNASGNRASLAAVKTEGLALYRQQLQQELSDIERNNARSLDALTCTPERVRMVVDKCTAVSRGQVVGILNMAEGVKAIAKQHAERSSIAAQTVGLVSQLLIQNAATVKQQALFCVESAPKEALGAAECATLVRDHHPPPRRSGTVSMPRPQTLASTTHSSLFASTTSLTNVSIHSAPSPPLHFKTTSDIQPPAPPKDEEEDMHKLPPLPPSPPEPASPKPSPA